MLAVIFAVPKTDTQWCIGTNVSRVRLRARTPPFHGGDTGSNPVRGTTQFEAPFEGLFYFIAIVLIRLHDHAQDDAYPPTSNWSIQKRFIRYHFPYI